MYAVHRRADRHTTESGDRLGRPAPPPDPRAACSARGRPVFVEHTFTRFTGSVIHVRRAGRQAADVDT